MVIFQNVVQETPDCIPLCSFLFNWKHHRQPPVKFHLSNDVSRCWSTLCADSRMSCFLNLHLGIPLKVICGRCLECSRWAFYANLWSIMWQITFWLWHLGFKWNRQLVGCGFWRNIQFVNTWKVEFSERKSYGNWKKYWKT